MPDFNINFNVNRDASRTASNTMLEMLRQEGMKAGLDFGVKEYDTGRSIRREDPLAGYFRGYAGSKERAEGYLELAEKIAAKGGDPMAGNSEIMKRYLDQLERATTALTGSEKALMAIAPAIGNALAPAAVQVVPPGGANNGPDR